MTRHLGIPRSVSAKAILYALVAFAALFATEQTAWSAPYEPNDNIVQASGPLVGDTDYDIVRETSNDVDWFYFYTSGQAQMSINLTHLAGQCGYSTELELVEADGSSTLAGLGVGSSNPLDDFLFTATGAKKFYLRAFDGWGSGSVGCTIRFRVSPGSALTATPAPTSLQIQACLVAQSNSGKYSRAIRAAQRRMKKSRKRSTRAKLRRKIRNYKVLLQRADQQIGVECTGAVLELIQNDQLKLQQ